MEVLAKIRPAVLKMLQVNMALQAGEPVLIVNDVPNLADWQSPAAQVEDVVTRSLLARKMYEIAREELKENRVDYLVYPCTGQHGTEPPATVAEKFLGYGVIIMATSFSLSHTRAREAASRQGARIASMPGIEAGMFLEGGPMAADYDAIRQETEAWAALLTQAQTARVTTPQGTDLTFSIAKRAGGADTGIMGRKGEWGNLPGGEAFIAPVEGTAQGRLVVPRGWYFDLQEDMILEFRDGYVVSLQGGGKVGEQFSRLLALEDEGLRHRRNCAELGIGTNPAAKKPDNVLEAEKIKGTVHIAVGDSSHMGGANESDLHEDFVLPQPTLYLDGKVLLG